MTTIDLQTLYDLTYARFWSGSKSETSAVSNAKAVVEGFSPSLPLPKITPDKIDTVILQWKQAGLSNATINRRLSALSRMLYFALSRGYIKTKPRIERLKEPAGRVRYLSREEEQRVISWFTRHGWDLMADLVVVLVDTGLRVGEALSLEPKNIQAGRVIVEAHKSKSGKLRTVPLTQRAAMVLQSRVASGLFSGLDNMAVTYRWNKMRKALGLMEDKEFVPHALRHTFCSRLVQAGVPLQVVKELAGHSAYEVTLRYAHLAPNQLETAIAALCSIPEISTVSDKTTA